MSWLSVGFDLTLRCAHLLDLVLGVVRSCLLVPFPPCGTASCVLVAERSRTSPSTEVQDFWQLYPETFHFVPQVETDMFCVSNAMSIYTLIRLWTVQSLFYLLKGQLVGSCHMGDTPFCGPYSLGWEMHSRAAAPPSLGSLFWYELPFY